MDERRPRPNLTTVDGDARAWLRSAVDVPLQPSALQGFLRGSARDVTRRHIERLRRDGRAEATGDLLERTSVRVVGDLLGRKRYGPGVASRSTGPVVVSQDSDRLSTPGGSP